MPTTEQINYGVYVLVAIVVFWVYLQEKRDLAPKNSGDILRSASWQDVQPDLTDTVPETIGKMQHLLRVTSRHVVWRRAVLSGVFATILVWAIALRRRPDWDEFLLSILATTIVFSQFWSHYTYHDFAMTERVLQNNLLNLDRKLSSMGVYGN